MEDVLVCDPPRPRKADEKLFLLSHGVVLMKWMVGDCSLPDACIPVEGNCSASPLSTGTSRVCRGERTYVGNGRHCMCALFLPHLLLFSSVSPFRFYPCTTSALIAPILTIPT